MRTKALVLAAHLPVKGPWVPVNPKLEWTRRIATRPQEAKANGAIELKAKMLDGGFSLVSEGSNVVGATEVQCSVAAITGVNLISVYLDSVEE